ncbi:MAG: hypothetical protein ACHQPI_00275 [Thermoanaerobaculia bacterium]
MIVLSGTAGGDGSRLLEGDALIGPPAALTLLGEARGARVLVEERDEPGRPEAVRIGRDDLVGAGLAGVTGVRFLHRSPGGVLLRLGPPPGVRWLVTGLRAVAVFSGRLLLFESGTTRTLSAGDCAVPEEPARTLRLQAGNDSAVALALGAPGVRIVIG